MGTNCLDFMVDYYHIQSRRLRSGNQLYRSYGRLHRGDANQHGPMKVWAANVAAVMKYGQHGDKQESAMRKRAVWQYVC